MPKTYNTPHRSFVVKTRLTEEHIDFMKHLRLYEMSQAEFMRQAINDAVSSRFAPSMMNCSLAIDKLSAEHGKIGGNLNQIARTLNEWHRPHSELAAEVLAASDLAVLKYEVLQKVEVSTDYLLGKSENRMPEDYKRGPGVSLRRSKRF